MKTAAVDNPNFDQLQKLDRELKSKIKSREKEIEAVDQLYSKKIGAEKRIGEENYQNQIDMNDVKIKSANQEFENKLKNYSEHLESTKLELDRQEKNLKNSYQNQTNASKLQFEDNMSNIFADSSSKVSELQFKGQEKFKELDQQNKNETTKIEAAAHKNLNTLSTNYNNRYIDVENDFRNKMAQDIREHQSEIIRQKDQFKKNIDQETSKNQRLEQEKVRVQQDELTYLDKYHKNLMEQKISDFKTKYQNLANEHEQILKNIKTNLDEEVKKLQINTMETKRDIATKKDDPFYRIDKLEPKITEEGNFYFLKLNVPAHEKENVHLVTNGRKIKITLNKRFEDLVEDKDGTVNRSSKTQLYSKEVMVKDLINPKNMQVKYEDGEITYKIAKL
jgi:HSP20 family molecular chaperone IbpA